MDKLAERMATVLQWIYDDGEGGNYRPDIQQVLVAYNAAQQSAVAEGGKILPEEQHKAWLNKWGGRARR